MADTTKTLLSVGAGPGVGIEVARRFGRAGYRVGLVRRSRESLEAMVDELRAEGIDARGAAADAYDADALTGVVTALATDLDGLGVLHHAVPGPLGQGFGPALEMSPELLRTFVDARVVSALVAAQAALPYLRRSAGAMVFTSGSADRTAHPGTGIVGVPQAALRMLVAHLRQEVADEGVYVGLVPVAGVPAYRDPAADAARTDVGPGVQLGDRVTAADVAEVHYRLATVRDRDEWIVGDAEKGLASAE